MGLIWKPAQSASANTNDDFSIFRTKVPGGWLVILVGLAADTGAHLSGLTFYPDPHHAWDGSSLPEMEAM